MKIHAAMLAVGLMVGSCATLPPPVPVVATGATATGPEHSRLGDAAIWSGGFGRAQPGLAGAGFIVGAGHAGGVVVHDFQGRVAQSVAGRRLSGLDVAGLPLETGYVVVVGGLDARRARPPIVLYRLERGEGRMVALWGETPTDLSGPTGFCMRQSGGVVHALAMDRRGEVRQFTIGEGPSGALDARESRRFRVASAGPGCAIDPSGGYVYFSRSAGGFWRYRLDPAAVAEPVALTASSPRRVPRSLGVSFMTQGSESYLTSLDQDRSAFSVWGIERGDLTWLGRFEVLDRPEGRAVRSLTGIDAYGGDIGPYAEGVVVVQDQGNRGAPNLKYVDWAAVRRALNF